ncbi:Putative glutaredoxin [Gryllus bimaculatus]|nr:Putative glutaredoxin [Gryllus bimaculatus]
MIQVGSKCDELRQEVTTQVEECKDQVEERHTEVGRRIDSLSTELERQNRDNGVQFGEIREQVQDVREATRQELEAEIARKMKAAEDKIEKLREAAKAKVFNKINVTYSAIELDKRDDADAIQDILGEITGARTVPRVFVKGQCIGGGTDVKKMYEAGKLEVLLQ